MTTQLDVPGFAARLAWLAEHGVDIYQFLGEEHIDDAKKFAQQLKPKRPTRPHNGPGRRRAARGSYKGPGFSKVPKKFL